jgi:hypothetical protein
VTQEQTESGGSGIKEKFSFFTTLCVCHRQADPIYPYAQGTRPRRLSMPTSNALHARHTCQISEMPGSLLTRTAQDAVGPIAAAVPGARSMNSSV